MELRKLCIVLTLLLAGAALFLTPLSAEESPYAGQEAREIKALSDDDLAGYLAGGGMGMAKTAELNGYPGPKHVLELAGELELTPAQRAETQRIYDAMHAEAQGMGEVIIGKEGEFEALFRSGEIREAQVLELAEELGSLNGRLRAVHLSAHLGMMKILTPGQVELYSTLRGYGQDSGSGAQRPDNHDMHGGHGGH